MTIEEPAAATGSAVARKPARLVAGVVVASLALFLSLRGVSHDAVRDAMHAASLSWTAAALLATLTTIAVVTWRWGLLLGLDRAVHWGRLWNAVLIGQAVNIVFPLRFGEAARVASMSRSTGWPMGRVAAALAVERVCDGAAFAVVVLFLVTSGRLPARFMRPLPTMLAVAVLTLVGVVVVVAWLPKLLRLFPASSTSRIAKWMMRQASGAEQAWRILSGGRLAGVMLLTAVVLVCSASVNYLVFRAFDLPVPVVAAVVLLAVLQVGTAVVSVPGNIGIFQYVTVLTLGAWNVPDSTALAVSLVLHVVSLGPRVALGAIGAMGNSKFKMQNSK